MSGDLLALGAVAALAAAGLVRRGSRGLDDEDEARRFVVEQALSVAPQYVAAVNRDWADYDHEVRELWEREQYGGRHPHTLPRRGSDPDWDEALEVLGEEEAFALWHRTLRTYDERGTEAARELAGSAYTVSDLRAALEQVPQGSRAPGLAAEQAPRSPGRPKVAEVFLSLDPREVSDVLLLGVLLAGATSNRSPMDVANDLLHRAGGDLMAVMRSDLHSGIRGLGAAGRARTLAARELMRRAEYRATARSTQQQILSPEQAVELLRTMALGDVEQLVAVYLDRRRRVIGTRVLTRGSDQFTVVDPKQIYRHAVEMGASAVLMAHNHPSGDPTPSSMDKEVTRRVASAGRVIGIPLLDHVVIGGSRWTSLAEQGYI